MNAVRLSLLIAVISLVGCNPATSPEDTPGSARADAAENPGYAFAGVPTRLVSQLADTDSPDLEAASFLRLGDGSQSDFSYDAAVGVFDGRLIPKEVRGANGGRIGIRPFEVPSDEQEGC